MDAQVLFEKLKSETQKNPNDIAVVLDALITIILEKMAAGGPVEFGEIGQFVNSDYGKLAFEVNPEFARIVNYKYETIQPIPVEDHNEDQPEEGLIAEDDIVSAEIGEEEFVAAETPAEDSALEDISIDEEPIITTEEETTVDFEEESLPEPESTQPVAEEALEEMEIPMAEEPAVSIGTEPIEEPSPFLSGPEPVSIGEPAAEETDIPVIPEPLAPPPPPEPMPVSEPEPEPVYTPPAPEPPLPVSTPPSYQYSTPEPQKEEMTMSDQPKINPHEYNLSTADLGKEMDQKKIWGFIILGVVLIVAAIWFFMSGDKEKTQEMANQAQGADTATVVSEPVVQAEEPVLMAEPPALPSSSPVQKKATEPAKKPVKETKQAAKPAAEPKPTTRKSTAPASLAGDEFKVPVDPAKGGFTINVASLPTQGAAEMALKSWNSRGYKGIVQEAFIESMNKTVYRVRIGQFRTRTLALQGLDEIKSDVPDAWIDKLK